VVRRVATGVEAANRDRPGPLTHPAVLGELGGLELFGASTIEAFLECPYRWFVNHELRPRPLAPRPDPLTQGGVVHAVLERLYREPPGGDFMPRPKTLDAWRERAASLLDEEAKKARVAPRDAATRTGYARMLGLIDAFLDREAVVPEGLRPDPELIEARFGSDAEDQRPPLELDEGVGIHGKIDRIDVGGANGERAGLVRDYKLGGKVAKVADFEREGKVQLPLYALAAEQLFGLRPLGGLYMPLGATKDPKGRGLLNEEDPAIGLLGSWGTDLLSGEAFRAELRRAVDTTLEAAKRLKRGGIERKPIKGICPSYCTFQAICRRERGVPEQQPDEEEVAEA
jgi:ATP-dependent helicase/DNAse subunit B